MKVNVYLNYDMPAEAITAAGDITEDALTPQQKMRYYHVLYQGYTKTGDEEKSIEYLDKYFTVYNIIYGESKTEFWHVGREQVLKNSPCPESVFLFYHF